MGQRATVLPLRAQALSAVRELSHGGLASPRSHSTSIYSRVVTIEYRLRARTSALLDPQIVKLRKVQPGKMHSVAMSPGQPSSSWESLSMLVCFSQSCVQECKIVRI